MDKKQQKKELRRQLLKQRQALSPQQWQGKSARLCDNLQSLPIFQNARTILAYFSFKQEPDLSLLFSHPARRWAFPRCVEGALVWHLWQPGEGLEKGVYGINEPPSSLPLINPEGVDLILVPAVACDWQGYRLGYGGGFYDRLLNLPQWQHLPTIGIVFDFAYLPKLPVESWDRPLDYICTDVRNQCLVGFDFSSSSSSENNHFISYYRTPGN
jgi:5-formyltetrahydrofolate cyclo-ligase